MSVVLRVLCAWLVVLAAGCERTPEGAQWLAEVEAGSAEASRLERAGDLAGARATLMDALAVPVGEVHEADVRVVRQDLLYRLAMVEMNAGRLGEARRFADEGLGLGRTNDVFTANLLLARGRVFEADGDALSASRDYHDALLINEALLGEALGDEGAVP